MRTGALRARQRVLAFMKTPIVISRAGVPIYTGKCAFKSAEANQGQAAHADPVEANQKALHTYDVWVPYDAPVIMESDDATLTTDKGALDLVVIATEAEATNKVSVQLRCSKHRLATPVEAFTFVRIDDDTGDETTYGPYDGQMIIEGPTPIGQGEVVMGGVNYYLQGSVMLHDKTADVQGGDRFNYHGRFGEVLGLPAPATDSDRLQVKVRIPTGGVG